MGRQLEPERAWSCLVSLPRYIVTGTVPYLTLCPPTPRGSDVGQTTGVCARIIRYCTIFGLQNEDSAVDHRVQYQEIKKRIWPDQASRQSTAVSSVTSGHCVQ